MIYDFLIPIPPVHWARTRGSGRIRFTPDDQRIYIENALTTLRRDIAFDPGRVAVSQVGAPIAEACEVDLIFTLPIPTIERTVKKRAKGSKKVVAVKVDTGKPTLVGRRRYPDTKPDIDNLEKMAIDLLVKARVLADDRFVCRVVAEKSWELMSGHSFTAIRILTGEDFRWGRAEHDRGRGLQFSTIEAAFRQAQPRRSILDVRRRA